MVEAVAIVALVISVLLLCALLAVLFLYWRWRRSGVLPTFLQPSSTRAVGVGAGKQEQELQEVAVAESYEALKRRITALEGSLRAQGIEVVPAEVSRAVQRSVPGNNSNNNSNDPDDSGGKVQVPRVLVNDGDVEEVTGKKTAVGRGEQFNDTSGSLAAVGNQFDVSARPLDDVDGGDDGAANDNGAEAKREYDIEVMEDDDSSVEVSLNYVPQQEVRKVWRIRNNGKREWPEDTRLVFLRSDAVELRDEEPVVVGKVAPGGEARVSKLFVAPPEAGNFSAEYALDDDEGLLANLSPLNVSLTVMEPRRGTNPDLPNSRSPLDESYVVGSSFSKQEEDSALKRDSEEPLQRSNSSGGANSAAQDEAQASDDVSAEEVQDRLTPLQASSPVEPHSIMSSSPTSNNSLTGSGMRRSQQEGRAAILHSAGSLTGSESRLRATTEISESLEDADEALFNVELSEVEQARMDELNVSERVAMRIARGVARCHACNNTVGFVRTPIRCETCERLSCSECCLAFNLSGKSSVVCKACWPNAKRKYRNEVRGDAKKSARLEKKIDMADIVFDKGLESAVDMGAARERPCARCDKPFGIFRSAFRCHACDDVVCSEGDCSSRSVEPSGIRVECCKCSATRATEDVAKAAEVMREGGSAAGGEANSNNSSANNSRSASSSSMRSAKGRTRFSNSLQRLPSASAAGGTKSAGTSGRRTIFNFFSPSRTRASTAGVLCDLCGKKFTLFRARVQCASCERSVCAVCAAVSNKADNTRHCVQCVEEQAAQPVLDIDDAVASGEAKREVPGAAERGAGEANDNTSPAHDSSDSEAVVLEAPGSAEASVPALKDVEREHKSPVTLALLSPGRRGGAGGRSSAKRECTICGKPFGFFRRAMQCDECQRDACSQCVAVRKSSGGEMLHMCDSCHQEKQVRRFQVAKSSAVPPALQLQAQYETEEGAESARSLGGGSPRDSELLTVSTTQMQHLSDAEAVESEGAATERSVGATPQLEVAEVATVAHAAPAGDAVNAPVRPGPSMSFLDKPKSLPEVDAPRNVRLSSSASSSDDRHTTSEEAAAATPTPAAASIDADGGGEFDEQAEAAMDEAIPATEAEVAAEGNGTKKMKGMQHVRLEYVRSVPGALTELSYSESPLDADMTDHTNISYSDESQEAEVGSVPKVGDLTYAEAAARDPESAEAEREEEEREREEEHYKHSFPKLPAAAESDSDESSDDVKSSQEDDVPAKQHPYIDAAKHALEADENGRKEDDAADNDAGAMGVANEKGTAVESESKGEGAAEPRAVSREISLMDLSEEKQNVFKKYKTSGEHYEANGKPALALYQYRKSLSVLPSAGDVKRRVDRLESELRQNLTPSDTQSKKKMFNAYVREAKELERGEAWTEAAVKYNKALSLFPNHKKLPSKIALMNKKAAKARNNNP